MDALERLRHVLAKQVGRRQLTLNQVTSWAVHYWLTAGDDKQRLKALTAGMALEESILKGGGNPGTSSNGLGRPVLVGAGGSERILPPRPVPGSVKRRGGKLAQSDQTVAAPQF
jgi:hypothetical protein